MTLYFNTLKYSDYIALFFMTYKLLIAILGISFNFKK